MITISAEIQTVDVNLMYKFAEFQLEGNAEPVK